MRRRQNNPILTGEAGVGKTAVVEGFALRIAAGDVPPQLKDVSLRTLDLGLLQAGASMKGEFENRLRQVIEEVQASPQPIILFIDEAHTLIGAGGAAGQGDAANLLKPALARGTLRTIAATTWAEYKKYFEKDPALTRRFQVIKVEEPDEDKAVLMIRGLAPVLEKHHRVLVLDEALESAARLSHRYIPSRQLPDKAVSLIDTACARVAISQHATPPQVEDVQRHIEALQTEHDILTREMTTGSAHEERVGGDRRRSSPKSKARLAELDAHWAKEKEIVGKIIDLKAEAARRGRRHERRRPKEAKLPRRLRRRPEAAPQIARLCSPNCAPTKPSLRVSGREPADLSESRCAGRGGRDRRLDRHSRGAHGEERNPGAALARRHAGEARHRPAPRPGSHRQAHSDHARRARQSEQTDRRLHARRARAASAKPKPR